MGDARETAGSTIVLTLAYVRERAGEDGVRRVLELAGDRRSLAELADETEWSTYDQRIALFEAAAEVLGDRDAARRIGETALDFKLTSGVKPLLRALGSTAALLRQIPPIAGRFSRVATMEAPSVSGDAATLTYRVDDAHQANAHDCAFITGILSRVPTAFGLPPASVVHDECQVDGAERCVYDLRWQGKAVRPRMSRRARVADLEDQIVTLLEQQQSFEATMADLVSPTDLPAVLSRITSRAARAVGAQRFV